MENQTCDWEQMRGRPWVGTHANWETSRKCWHMINLQGVRCVYEGGLHLSDPTHVHTRCVTHLLPRYAGDVFLFLAQIGFPVPDSVASGAQQHCSLFPGAASCSGWSVHSAQSSALCFEAEPAKCGCRRRSQGLRRQEDAWQTYGEFKNCQVIVMLCHRFGRSLKRLLADD